MKPESNEEKGQPELATFEDKKVLIVDDVASNIILLKHTLADYGLTFLEARSGEKALSLLERSVPDLILLDVNLPGLNGFDTCREIKSRASTQDTPIIFITGRDNADDLVRGFYAGGADYIRKPINREEVIARVRTQLHLRALFQEKEKMITELLSYQEKQERLIEELLGLRTELENLSKTDPLTKLLNRRGMIDMLEKESSRTDRSKSEMSFSLIIADIDGFKGINDTFGHEAGDNVLVEIAKTLTSNLRRYDSVCRWGGEEFLFLLPDTNLEEGRLVAQKLRERVGAISVLYQEQEISVSMSLGVSQFSGGDEDLNACINRADKALYQAKRRGRNQVVVQTL